MSRLKLPARKLFLCQVKQSRCTGKEEGFENLHSWSVDLKGRRLDYSMVWVQGAVTQNLPDGKTFVLSDDTDTVTVDRSTAVPAVGEMQPGSYVMVIGEVTKGPTGLVISAVKIQDLTADTVARGMWKHEVIDLQTHAL